MSSAQTAERSSLQPLGDTQVMVEYLPDQRGYVAEIIRTIVNGEPVPASSFSHAQRHNWTTAIDREVEDEAELRRNFAADLLMNPFAQEREA